MVVEACPPPTPPIVDDFVKEGAKEARRIQDVARGIFPGRAQVETQQAPHDLGV